MAVNEMVASDQWKRFRYCLEKGHYDFVEKAKKCDNSFAGDQWVEADRQALRAARRPALTINKIISTVSTIMGEQIYNRNEVSFRPAGQGATSDVADALTKVWTQIAAKNQLNWLRSDVFADGIIRSRGFYDVRMDFSTSMVGTVKIALLNSKNVVIDPDAEEYDPDEWGDIFITKWLSPATIALLYNEHDAEYLGSKDGSTFDFGYDSIEKGRDSFSGLTTPQGTPFGIDKTSRGVQRSVRVIERQYRVLTSQKHFVDVQTGDTRPVPEAWDRDRISNVLDRLQGQLSVISRRVKRVRWTATADNVVLHDDWSPYKRFTPVPYFPHFRHGRTIGLVENLLDPQDLLNKSSSQELHVINTTANSGWKVKAGSLVNMSAEDLEQSGAQTGLVLELKDVGDAEKITPNATPQGLDRVSYKSEEHMKTISGVSDSMQGFDREDVAAKAITAKRQSGQANLVRVMDNLERSDWFLARAVLDLVQTYYTEERMLHITGNDLTNSHETFSVNQYDEATDQILNDLTLGEYGIIITSTPDRATLEDSQFEQARMLKELGIAIPDDVLIENSRLQRRGEIVKQMNAVNETPEAQQKAELEMRAAEANVSKLEGEAKEKHVNAALNAARAQKEGVEAQNLAQGGDSAETMRVQQEMQLERERFEMERQERAEKLQFEREKAQLSLEQMRAEHAMKMQIQQEDAAQRRRQQEMQHYEQRAQAAARPATNDGEPRSTP